MLRPFSRAKTFEIRARFWESVKGRDTESIVLREWMRDVDNGMVVFCIGVRESSG